MEFGKNARVGNLIVFNREGAIRAYQIFCEIFNRDMTIEASVAQSSALKDMMQLGFTPEEMEDIELSLLQEA